MIEEYIMVKLEIFLRVKPLISLNLEKTSNPVPVWDDQI